MTVKRSLISLICAVLILPLAAVNCLSQSAWQELIRQNPAVVDDPSIDWRERLILDVLTPEQAQRHYWGTRAEDLVLESGQTLAEYLAARTNPPGSVYVPLPGACELFSVEDLLPDESLGLEVRGQCGIPEEATAVILQIKTESIGGSPRVKLWAADLPEPAEAVVDGSNASFEDLKTTTAIVTLCAGDQCRAGELRVKGTGGVRIHAEAVGYFRLFSPADGTGLGGDIHFYTEDSSNNFFGTNAGYSTTTGYDNAFFGGHAGYFNTTGTSNAFFGYRAGFSNTTGNANAFFGAEVGISNTTGDDNAFFGAYTGYDNTTGNYNAFFGGYAGSSNTTGNYNAFFGYRTGNSSTTGASNAFFGYKSGYSNTTGASNAFVGRDAGYSNTEGADNAFFGAAAGWSNTTGHDNAFFGRAAGYFNTTGNYNAFFGRSAGHFNATGTSNAFFGYMAGYSNTTGHDNAFVGRGAGGANTGGYSNAFFGRSAGSLNTTGASNAFFGGYAGYFNTSGTSNAFVGDTAGWSNTVEAENTFIGASANLDPGPDPSTSPVTNATAIGNRAYVSKSNSLVLGSINGVNDATASTQVGIGVTAPERLLHIAGDNAVFRMDRSTNSAAFMLVRTNSSGGVLKNFVVGVDASGANQGQFVINDLGTALGGPGQRRLTIDNSGDVIINGDLITNAGPLTFPDYVFAKDYDLMPLGALREYVETQRHLPEIPSAEEIQTQGQINVTELQLKLLQKIEELTLYTIEQQAAMDQQDATIEQLREQNSQLSAQLIEQNRLVNARLEVLERTDSSDR